MKNEKDKGISNVVNIPEGITATLDGTVLTLKGTKGELSRDFFSPLTKIAKKDSSIEISSKLSKRKFIRILQTETAHLMNMIKGVSEGFIYEVIRDTPIFIG